MLKTGGLSHRQIGYVCLPCDGVDQRRIRRGQVARAEVSEKVIHNTRSRVAENCSRVIERVVSDGLNRRVSEIGDKTRQGVALARLAVNRGPGNLTKAVKRRFTEIEIRIGHAQGMQ